MSSESRQWAMAVVMVVFPIIGALKASNGDAWRYPGSFRFFG